MPEVEVVRDTDERGIVTYSIHPDTPSGRAILDAIRSWSCPSDLARFARERHGYGNTDGGFGVTYPGDLDEYDKAHGAAIADGFIEVYGFWGPPDGYEFHVPETQYLQVLAAYFRACGRNAQAQVIDALLHGPR